MQPTTREPGDDYRYLWSPPTDDVETRLIPRIEFEPEPEPVAEKHTARIVAVIPARNEEPSIYLAVTALKKQTRPPDRILVIINNTTDDTELAALEAGAETYVMKSNPYAKAGALNQGLEMVLPTLDDDDYVFVQDADTEPVPNFFERALKCTLKEFPGCIVSGRYACRAEGGYIGMMQRNEFAREGLRLNRRRNQTHIVVGTSCLLPVRALRHVHEARAAGKLPGSGYVYATTSRTEDYELTLALKTLGYKTMSPPECDAVTDIMNTVPKLWAQRKRWWRGGFEDLGAYGWTPLTRGFWGRQLGMLLGITSFLLYVAAVGWTLARGETITLGLVWIPITVLFMLDRVVEVRRAGPFAMVVAGLLIPELIYDAFLHITYFAAGVKGLRTALAARRGADVTLNATSAWKET